MKTQKLLIAHPSNENELSIIKAFFDALNIKFEVSSQIDKPYNPEFVAKIELGDKDLKNDKGRTVSMEELNSLWK